MGSCGDGQLKSSSHWSENLGAVSNQRRLRHPVAGRGAVRGNLKWLAGSWQMAGCGRRRWHRARSAEAGRPRRSRRPSRKVSTRPASRGAPPAAARVRAACGAGSLRWLLSEAFGPAGQGMGWPCEAPAALVTSASGGTGQLPPLPARSGLRFLEPEGLGPGQELPARCRGAPEGSGAVIGGEGARLFPPRLEGDPEPHSAFSKEKKPEPLA